MPVSEKWVGEQLSQPQKVADFVVKAAASLTRAIDSLVNNRLRFLTLITAFLLASSVYAQDTCSEEAKLLLSPTQLQLAILAFQARGKTHGRVYFYDTPARDLLSKGVILRFREGAKIDLTLKLRPLPDDKFVDALELHPECEVDLNDGVEHPSFSIQSEYPVAKVPATGEEFFRLLSEAQKSFLEESKVKINWRRVTRVAEIRSTSWTSRKTAPMGTLSLELWEWKGGSILEVSKKVAADAGQATYIALHDLAGKNRLALNTDQRSKTAIALGAITTAHPP
jgi:hypothetical protein